MKILLFGKNGQVGWELQRSLAPLGETIALDACSLDFCGDLTQPDEIKQTIRYFKPDVIVNAAAYTAVDKAESEQELAHALNARAPGILAEEAKRMNAWLVHYSTDYVFSGQKPEPHNETDQPGPLNVYGRTKLEGEVNIMQSGCNHLIFRTSWVYAAKGGNFIRTILRLAQQNDKLLNIIRDQTGAPTGADLLADVTANILASLRYGEKEVSGLYHLTAKGHTNWYDYARLILTQAQEVSYPLKITASSLIPIPSSDFTSPAQRPLNSRLNTEKLEQTFGIYLPEWRTGVIRALTEILQG